MTQEKYLVCLLDSEGGLEDFWVLPTQEEALVFRTALAEKLTEFGTIDEGEMNPPIEAPLFVQLSGIMAITLQPLSTYRESAGLDCLKEIVDSLEITTDPSPGQDPEFLLN